MNLRLLSLLADGQFHSGSALAEVCGVSRAAIWKQVQAITALGVEVNSIRGRGYKIPGGIDLLDAATFTKLLGDQSLWSTIDIVSVTESTNKLVQDAIARGEKRPLYVAEYQTGGRGRRGRTWVSPFAANLYFSMGWPFVGGVAALEGLSLAVGLAVYNALKSLGVEGVGLKWPNDLLLNGHKLGGILIEVGGDLSGDCSAVIGVGLNVRMPQSASQDIDQPWADLKLLTEAGFSRAEILAAVINSLTEMLAIFEKEGFASMQTAWQQAHAFQNQDVVIHQADRQIVGRCFGVDASGALKLKTDEGEMVFQGGEVSLRGVNHVA